MRGEEQRARVYSYDKGREVPQYITEKIGDARNFVENETGSERNYRKSVGDASVSLCYQLIASIFLGFSLLYFTAFNINLVYCILFIRGKKCALRVFHCDLYALLSCKPDMCMFAGKLCEIDNEIFSTLGMSSMCVCERLASACGN